MSPSLSVRSHRGDSRHVVFLPFPVSTRSTPRRRRSHHLYLPLLGFQWVNSSSWFGLFISWDWVYISLLFFPPRRICFSLHASCRPSPITHASPSYIVHTYISCIFNAHHASSLLASRTILFRCLFSSSSSSCIALLVCTIAIYIVLLRFARPCPVVHRVPLCPQ